MASQRRYATRDASAYARRALLVSNIRARHFGGVQETLVGTWTRSAQI